MTQFQFQSITVDTAKLPPVVIDTYLRRALSHVFHNESAAAVGPDSAWAKQWAKNGAAPSESDVSDAKDAWCITKLEALERGEVGAMRGPKTDPMESAVDRIVREELLAMLKPQGITKLPKDDGKSTITFANGQTRTYDQMHDNWLGGKDIKGLFGPAGEANRPRIETKAAKHVVEAKARADAAKAERAKVAANAKAAGPVVADDMGI